MLEVSNIERELECVVTGDTVSVTVETSSEQRSQLIRRHEEFTLEILDQGVPDRWTEAFVGERLVDAFRVLDRMPNPGISRKLGFWPESGDFITRAELNEHMKAGTLGMFYASRNHVRIPPSSHEIARMEEAIGWPAKYLKADPQLAGIVNFWALDADVYDEAPPPVRVGLRLIAKGLRRDRVTVR